MCGRFSIFAPPDDVEERFDARIDFDWEPRYNAAPGQRLPVIAGDEPDVVRRMEWGFVPSWADARSDFEFVNARAETVAEKRSFRDAYERRRRPRERSEGGLDTPKAGRCLIPADGFFEWAPENGGTRPYRITLEGDDLFAMAGIWARWTPTQTQTGLGDFGGGSGSADGTGNGSHPDPAPVETFAILTTEPNDVVADLHDRMPVILSPGEESTWLAGDPDEAGALLDPYPAAETRAYPVSTAVNDPSNDSPAVVREVET